MDKDAFLMSVGVAVFFAMLIIAIISVFNVGLKKTEYMECVQWSNEARDERYMPNYYITQWQKDQCDHYGITIEAPVR